MGRHYGRAPVGEPAIIYDHPTRPESFSLAGALVPEGILSAMFVEGSVDGDAFLAWCEQALCAVLRPGDLVVMDNLRVHHMDRIVEAIESTGAEVCFLPPYSPDFNPIEMLWAWVKKLVRDRAPRTAELLQSAVGQVLRQVSHELSESWIASCGW